MKASEAPKAIRSATHFVSPETEQHQPVPVDLDHAEMGEGSIEGDGCVESVGENAHVELDHSQHATGEFEHKGEAPKRVVKTTKVAERHVQSQPGLKVAAERSAHVKSVRAQREKENFGN